MQLTRFVRRLLISLLLLSLTLSPAAAIPMLLVDAATLQKKIDMLLMLESPSFVASCAPRTAETSEEKGCENCAKQYW